jgi:hypothetical protein
LFFSPRNELLLSVCREKKLNWYSTNPADENHQYVRGSYTLSSWGMSIVMDELTRQCFVGDSTGSIHFLKIDNENKCQLSTKLNGHTGLNNKDFILLKILLFLNRKCAKSFMGYRS